MNSKPKIDMGSLIQKVTKSARELLKKKSKPQTKGKSANGTSRYSKSKRQKLLIGGVNVNIEGSRDAINNILSSKTEQNKEGKAHLVHLLKLQTIKKINEIYQNLLEIMARISEHTPAQIKHEEDIAKILDIIEDSLKVTVLEENAIDTEFTPTIENTYEYDFFVGNFDTYKLYGLEQDIIALNIFKMFKQLLNVRKEDTEFDPKIFKGGKINGGEINTELKDKSYHEKLIYMIDRVKKYTKLMTDVRANFVGLRIMAPSKKKRRDDGLDNDLNDDFLEDFEDYSSISPEMKSKLNSFIQTVKIGGNIKEIKQQAMVGKTKILWSDTNGFDIYVVNKNPILIKINDFFNEEVRKDTSKNKLVTIKKNIDEINTKITLLIESYKSENKTEIAKIQGEITKIVGNIKKLYIEIAISKGDGENGYIPLIVEASTTMGTSSTRTAHQLALGQDPFISNGGGNPVKYKSTGQVVHIMFQNKKYKRVIYVKEKRNTKYCKMNNEYILLSKLKVVE